MGNICKGILLFVFISLASSKTQVVEDIEKRTFDESNINAAVTNLTDGYFLFKALLIYWFHVSLSKIVSFSMADICCF